MPEADVNGVGHPGNSGDDEEWDGTDEMRKRKLDEYMEDLYKLEFNDIVRYPPLFAPPVIDGGVHTLIDIGLELTGGVYAHPLFIHPS